MNTRLKKCSYDVEEMRAVLKGLVSDSFGSVSTDRRNEDLSSCELSLRI